MRIAHSMLEYGLVSETFVRDAIAEAEARGWENWVVAQAAESTADLPLPPERLMVARPADRVTDRVANRLTPRTDPDRKVVARQYRRMIEEIRPGLVHAHFGWAAADSVLGARKAGVPLLTSFHGTDLTVYPGLPEWREPYAALLAHTARATVVSRFLEGKLRALGYRGPIDVLPPGVRLSRFEFRAPQAPRDGRCELLFVGRLIECKGLDVLLRALQAVRSDVRGATLSVIGDGEQREALERLAGELGLAAAVRFEGALPHEAVADRLRAADVLVMPSRAMPDGQAEGSPVVTKEAQAIGLPVVATDVGGVPETIPPPLRDELVPGGDYDALAARLTALWRDAPAWPDRARIGREWVEREFDWARLGGRLSAIYDEMTTAEARAA